MSLSSLAGVLLAMAGISCLWLAALRLASPIAPCGVERALAAAVAVAAAIVIESLALGIVHAGTETLVLVPAAAATWLVSRLVLPAPALPLRTEMAAAWRQLDMTSRYLVGGAAGLLLAWAGYFLSAPTLDLDSTFFHLPQVAGWVADGRPGSIQLITTEFPIGNYPCTNEVILAWTAGVSHNMAFVLLWPVVGATMLVLSLFVSLRSFQADGRLIALTSAALILVPVVSDAITSLDTDLLSIAWAAVGVALCLQVATRRSPPELLAFAVVAFALAIGTKTTVAPLALISLLIAWRGGSRRPRALPMVASAVIAAMAGGVWYLRNLLEHGNPLWPFVDLPGGDPLPLSIDGLSARFAQNPIATLDGRVGLYLDQIGATPILLAGALVLPLLTRDRRLALGSAAVAIGCALWALAPVTGVPDGPDAALFSVVAGVRYLMPTILLATIVLGMVASRQGRVAIAARAVLAAAALWGLIDLASGRDGVPAIWIPILGIGAGVAVVALAGRSRGRMPLPRVVASLAVALLAIVALAAYPGRFLSAYADPTPTRTPLSDSRETYNDLAVWFDGRPGFLSSDAPILFAGPLVGPLAGGAITHDLQLIEASSDCAEIRSEASGGWVVVSYPVAGPRPAALECFADAAPDFVASPLPGVRIEVFAVADG